MRNRIRAALAKTLLFGIVLVGAGCAVHDAEGLGGVSNPRTVYADGVTITGNGTSANPLVATGGGGGSGTVTSVSVVTANGVSGSVATATTTPAITLTLGDITPTTVNGVTLSGTSTPNLAVTGAATVSGTNTGDQTSVSGNAGTATAFAANPTDCSVGQFANAIAANGNLTCGTPAGGGDALTTQPLSQFASTTSAELAGVLTNESGTGLVAYTISPSFTTPAIGAATATSVNGLTISSTNGTLTLASGSSLVTSGANSITLTSTGSTNVTLPTTGTLVSTAGNVATATALAANPADCSANNYATSIAANGDLTCGQVSASAGISGTLAVGNGGTGATTLTGILVGNGTSAFTAVTAPSGAIVGTTDSQTLTNKTLTSPVLNGTVSGTGVATAATASTLALRDSNGILTSANFNQGYTTTVTAAGNTTLTAASNELQFFSGSTSQTVTLPVVSTLALGHTFRIHARSGAGPITVNSSGGNQVWIVPDGYEAEFKTTANSGTDASAWWTTPWQVIATPSKRVIFTSNLNIGGTDGTLTFQGTDTYVGRATTDTLTNKTLTAPKFADLGYIADANGNEMLEFDTVGSAIGNFRIINSATVEEGGPTLAAVGGANVSMKFAATGFYFFNPYNGGATTFILGEDTANGTDEIVFKAPESLTSQRTITFPDDNGTLITDTATQTLTNKTLELPSLSVTSGITASTTQTQGQGALTKDINAVATVANSNDTVTLPTAVTGRCVKIANNGANTLRIYPASGDNLGSGVNTSTTLNTATNRQYCAYDATNWEVF